MNNLEYYIRHYDSTLLLKKMEVSESRLDSLIKDASDVNYSELLKFSKIFNSSMGTLLNEAKSDILTSPLFRKQIGVESNDLLVKKISQWVLKILDLNPPKSFDFQLLNSPVENNILNAENLALNFRDVFFNGELLSPILDLAKLISELNIIIIVSELGNKVDGACAKLNGVSFIFLSPRFSGRMLFSLAHELGHIINHLSSEDYLIIDSESETQSNGNEIENFASHFASSLLLPAKGAAQMITLSRQRFGIEASKPIGDLEILFLARYFGLSFDATAQRLEILKLLPKGGAYSLSSRIKEDYSSPEIRAKSLGIPERGLIKFKLISKPFISTIIGFLSSGTFSIGDICQRLNITRSELNDLMREHGKDNN